MTRERADELLSEVTVLDDPEMAEAHRVAISALRQQETVTNRNGLNEPLTLDELRKMDGEVWVCYPQAIFGSNLPPAEDMSCSRYKFRFSDYGKTWLAYRQKPEEGTD